MPVLRRAAVAALAAATLVACGGDDETEALRPSIESIAPAVAALEAELGGPQQYFEINATAQFVNLFVAVDGATQVRAYVYVGGELGPPKPAEGAEGVTFAAADLAFDAERVLHGVSDELPDSDITVFSVIEGADGAPQYSAIVESDEGGVLDVTFGGDGTVEGIVPG